MNILFLASWYPTNEDPTKGIFIYRQAKILSSENVIHSFCLTENKNLGRKINIVYNKLSNNYHENYLYYNTSNYLLKLLVFLYFNLYCLNYIIKNKIEIIHLNVIYPIGVILYPILLFSRRPIFISEHWSGYFREDGRFYKLNWIIKNIIIRLFKKSHKIYVVSKSLKEVIDDLMKKSNKESNILFNDLRIPKNLEYRKFLDIYEIRILVIATLEEHSKNILGILEAFDDILKYRNNVSLIIVGDGPDLNKIINYKSSNENWNEKVCFVGRVSSDQVLEYYKKCHFYVINSNFETFSISTAEALLHGLPVVSTNCYGPTEYINLNNGLIIERGNNEQLIKALNYMISNWNNYDSYKIQQDMIMYYSKYQFKCLNYYS